MAFGMKFGLAFLFAHAHIIVLIPLAEVSAESAGWKALGTTLACLGGLFVGLFPFVRSIAIVALCFFLFKWQQAIWICPLLVMACWFFNTIGMAMMKRDGTMV